MAFQFTITSRDDLDGVLVAVRDYAKKVLNDPNPEEFMDSIAQRIDDFKETSKGTIFTVENPEICTVIENAMIHDGFFTFYIGII